MRNLKKVLALVVAVAMIASMGFVASAANYSDVASNASYADAVNLLSNLGIITGYEDGTFRPDNTVTRAEAATMMVRMLNLVDGVEAGDTIFTDVDGAHWASGYVNVAVANGIVNGMGDGTFAPEGEVTYGQIVKMLVCALGYEPVAAANGGWNGGGYIYAGSKAGFTKGVSGTANAAASRATVAKLIYNALEVELMEQDSYSTGIYGDTFKVQKDKTILSEYLELEKVEGVIVSTYLSDTAYEEGNNEVEIIVTKSFVEEEDANYVVGTSYPVVADGTNAATLLGYSVVAYLGESEDGDDTMFAVAEKAGKNSALTLDAEDIVEFNSDDDGDYVEYYKSTRGTTKGYIDSVIEFKDVADKAFDGYVVNGFNNADYTDEFDIADAEEITFIDNDNDGNFEFMSVVIANENNCEEFVVESVDVEEGVIEGTESGEEFVVEYEDEDKLYTIVKDGQIVELDAIAEGDVITVLDYSVPVITVHVSSVKVEGTVDETDDGVYTISGKEYEVSALSAKDVEAPEAGDEGIYYINASGKIAHVESVNEVSAADYAYVIDTHEKVGDFGDTEYLVKVVTATGEVEVLTFKNTNVTVYDETGVATKKLDADEAFAKVENYTGIVRLDLTAAGEISVVYLPGAESTEFEMDEKYAAENDYEYNEARGRYGTLKVASSTVVFHVDSDKMEDDAEEAITITTVGNLFVDGSSYKFSAYGEAEYTVAEVLVVTDAMAALSTEAPVMVVTKVSDVDVDGDPTQKITGLVAGEKVTIVIDPEDEEKPVVEVGNVVLYAETAGYATDVQVLFTSTEDAPGAIVEDLTDIAYDIADDELVSIHYVEIDEKEEGSFTTLTGEEFFLADDCNITVVDYSYRDLSVTKGSASKLGASTRTYKKTVFVKTSVEVEDEVTDVVIFIEEIK